MKTRLAISAATKLLSGVVMVGAMLFWPAGTWCFWHGWLFMAVLFIPISILGVVMLFCAPELLQKRLGNKEKEVSQRWVVALSGLLFIASFIVAGLNYRYGWHSLPQWVVWMAVAIFLLSYLMYAEVMRENAYLSRTVEVQEGQKVVDKGLYGVVRHPMYTATILLFLSMPLILGSIISFAIMVLYVPLIAIRIRNEERLLECELEGYTAYKQRVCYKVVPYIW